MSPGLLRHLTRLSSNQMKEMRQVQFLLTKMSVLRRELSHLPKALMDLSLIVKQLRLLLPLPLPKHQQQL